jgi:hypothetical protein
VSRADNHSGQKGRRHTGCPTLLKTFKVIPRWRRCGENEAACDLGARKQTDALVEFICISAAPAAMSDVVMILPIVTPQSTFTLPTTRLLKALRPHSVDRVKLTVASRRPSCSPDWGDYVIAYALSRR